jgi:hypothetical protein
MKCILERFSYAPDYTLGYLNVPGMETLATIEPSYFIARGGAVKHGEYELIPHSGPKYPKAYALFSEKLRVYPAPAPEAERVAILIHPANFALQLSGCIAVGLKHGILLHRNNRQWYNAVLSSREAVSKLFHMFDRQKETGQRLWIKITPLAEICQLVSSSTAST